MAMSAAEAEEWFDGIVATCGDYVYTCRQYPEVTNREPQDDSLTGNHWLFLQKLDKEKKKVFSFFDVVAKWNPPAIVEGEWEPSMLDPMVDAIEKRIFGTFLWCANKLGVSSVCVTAHCPAHCWSHGEVSRKY